jgi:hypothetical protein
MITWMPLIDNMDAPLKAYVAAYLTVSAIVAVVLIVRWRQITMFRTGYWRFVLAPWKAATFIVAMGALIIAGPYSGDHTWDFIDSSFMSVLTYSTAPWAVGMMYLVARGRRPLWLGIVAVCLMLFSASWSYDIYLLLKNGYYTDAWLENMYLSSCMYVNAGLLWNLSWDESKEKVVMAFVQQEWPTSIRPVAFRKVRWYAIALMLPSALMCLGMIILIRILI